MRKIVLLLILPIFFGCAAKIVQIEKPVRIPIDLNPPAITIEEVKAKYFKNKKIDSIEGIWIRSLKNQISDDNNVILYIKKEENFYVARYLRVSYTDNNFVEFYAEKIEDNIYIGDTISPFNSFGWTRGGYQGSTTLKKIEDGKFNEEIKFANGKSMRSTLTRIYPKRSTKNNNFGTKVVAKSGSAFFINDNGFVVTNNHVVEGCEDKTKIIYKSKEYKSQLVAKDSTIDLALMKADITKNPYLKISNEPLKKLQQIVVAGYPIGKQLSDDIKVTTGVISSLKGYEDNSNQFQTDAAVNPGNSGGPVVDRKTGELVGVAVAVLRNTEGIKFAIKASSLKNFLDSNRNKIPELKNISNTSQSVIDKLEDATLYIYCN